MEVSRETFLCRSQIPSLTPSPSLYFVNVAWKPQLWVDSIAGRLADRKASEDLARAGMAAGRGTR